MTLACGHPCLYALGLSRHRRDASSGEQSFHLVGSELGLFILVRSQLRALGIDTRLSYGADLFTEFSQNF